MLISRDIHIENENVNLKKGAPETASNLVGLPMSILKRSCNNFNNKHNPIEKIKYKGCGYLF